jgi:hypothetical protein
MTSSPTPDRIEVWSSRPDRVDHEGVTRADTFRTGVIVATRDGVSYPTILWFGRRFIPRDEIVDVTVTRWWTFRRGGAVVLHLVDGRRVTLTGGPGMLPDLVTAGEEIAKVLDRPFVPVPLVPRELTEPWRRRPFLGTVVWAVISVAAVVLASAALAGAVGDYRQVERDHRAVAGVVETCNDVSVRVPTCSITYDMDGQRRTTTLDIARLSDVSIGEPVTLWIGPGGRDVRVGLPIGSVVAASIATFVAALSLLGAIARLTALVPEHARTPAP